MVLDTHAGCGLYDLTDAAAQRTGEAQQGVLALLRGEPANLLEAYLAALAALNPGLMQEGRLQLAALRWYPGSPRLITAQLRAADRYIGCELHPDDFKLLRANLPRLPNFQLHERDGYEALLAFTPPPEKRGLVLIDPPFEQPGEFERIAETIAAAYARWRNGIFAVWYPIKDKPAVWQFQERMAATGIRKQLLLEFIYDTPAAQGLHGSGMLVVNPPWQLAEQMAAQYEKLHGALHQPVRETKIAWLVAE